MRPLFYLTIFTACAGSAWAENGTPFVNGVPSEVATQRGLNGNTLDKLGAWNESDVELPERSRGLSEGAGPSVHNLSISTNDGVLVLSQLWDASCTTSECPTQIYLLKNDGSREIKLEPTMLPQITPADDNQTSSRGIGGQPSIFLNQDGKSITTYSDEHGKEVIPLK
jgi:hypothetical protein